MLRQVAILLTVLAGSGMTAHPALADKRIALVIGNSAYRSVTPLPNPAKDAAAMADMLKKAGFDIVNAGEDVTNADMRKMVRDFAAQAINADVAVVYYGGHGIEINGTNYLLPVDSRLEHDTDVEDEAVSLDRIVLILDPVKKLRLVILDACRDNPFQQTMKRSLSSRGVARGLAKVEPGNPNTLIAYAAKAGSTASDGAGDHSPFTTALLKQLAVPGQDLRRSLGYVRDDVMTQTGNQQEPFVYGSLGGDDVVLVPGAARAAPAAVPAQVTTLDPNSPLRRDYELAAQVNTRDGWDAFLKSYPTGFYADLARAAQSKLAVTSSDRNLSALSRPSQPAPSDNTAANPAPSAGPSCMQGQWQASSLNNETASTFQTIKGGAPCTIHLHSSFADAHAVITSPPKSGKLTQINALTLRYEPNTGYRGTDQYTFRFCASDPNTGRSGCSTITYNVSAD